MSLYKDNLKICVCVQVLYICEFEQTFVFASSEGDKRKSI